MFYLETNINVLSFKLLDNFKSIIFFYVEVAQQFESEFF